MTELTSKPLRAFLDHDGPTPDYTHLAMLERDRKQLYVVARTGHDCHATVERYDGFSGKTMPRWIDEVLRELGSPTRLRAPPGPAGLGKRPARVGKARGPLEAYHRAR